MYTCFYLSFYNKFLILLDWLNYITDEFYVCHVCEVCLELLHDRGLLSCISIAKFKGKDSDKEIIVHIANREAYPNGGHILYSDSVERIRRWTFMYVCPPLYIIICRTIDGTKINGVTPCDHIPT